MKLNEKQIAALEEKGFRRWTKGSMDRLYINAETLGLEVSSYKTGNVFSAYYRGEKISNKRGSEMVSAKTYIDIETGELHATNWTLEQDARQLYEETLEALAASETSEDIEEIEETTVQANPYTAMTDVELNNAKAEMTGVIYASASGYNAHITTETRENALDALHQIRLAMWARGIDAPTEDDRDEFEAMRCRWNTKLERATDVTARYIALNGIRANQDALDYLAK